MARWNLDKSERKAHDGGTETVTHEATIHLDAEDPGDLLTLADIATLIGNLTSIDGIPTDAVLGNSLDVALRWTEEP